MTTTAQQSSQSLVEVNRHSVEHCPLEKSWRSGKWAEALSWLNLLKSLALPRGLRRPSEFNHLAKSGTHNRSTQSLGFLPPVSHLGRAVQLLASEDVAPSATVWLPITVFLAGHEDQLVCPIHPPPRAQTTPLLLQRAGRRERHRGCRRRDLATHRARPAVGAPRAFGFGPAAGRPL